MKFGLTENIIKSIIQVFESNPKVDKAFVFGSRSNGKYREASDIDIAIKGNDLNFDDVLHLGVKIDELDLPYKVDLLNYDSIKEPDLKDHIDRVGIELYSRWKEFKLGEVCKYVNRGVSPTYVENEGNIILNQKCIRNGRIDFGLARFTSKNKNYTFDKKLVFGDLLINSTGVGTAGRVSRFLKNDLCYVDTHVSIVRLDEKIADHSYVYYNLNSREDEIENYAEGSTGQIELGRERIKAIDILLPPHQEQTAIASILSSLDDKIDLLHRQNKTLEQLAETLFRQRFVEEAKESWEREPLGKYVTIKRGGSPRPIHDYISETGLNWLKISDVTSIDSPFIFEIKEKIKVEGLSKTTFLKKGSLILSNSATPGIPKILDVDTCIHDGWLHFPKSKFSKEFLYLFFKYIKPELLQFGNGSIFTNLKTDILKEYVLAIPDKNALTLFDEQVKTIFDKLYINQTQIRTLTQTRDTLLPKLMSGEVRVKMSEHD